MERLFIIDKKDYDPSFAHSKRPSVRAVITDGDKLLMVYSSKYGYYKFPGGGIEEGEGNHAALIREVREETGLEVIPESIEDFGSVLRLEKSGIFENTVFEQESFYYKCRVEPLTGEQSLDDYEKEAGFTLRKVSPEEAEAADRAYAKNAPDILNESMAVREAEVLRLIKKSL